MDWYICTVLSTGLSWLCQILLPLHLYAPTNLTFINIIKITKKHSNTGNCKKSRNSGFLTLTLNYSRTINLTLKYLFTGLIPNTHLNLTLIPCFFLATRLSLSLPPHQKVPLSGSEGLAFLQCSSPVCPLPITGGFSHVFFKNKDIFPFPNLTSLELGGKEVWLDHPFTITLQKSMRFLYLLISSW